MESTSKVYAIFSALFAPSMGGVENYTAHLAERLAVAGNRAIVVTSRLDGRPAWEHLPSGVEVVRLPARVLLDGRLPLPRWNDEYRDLLARLAAIPFDGVIVNTRFYGLSLAGMRFAREKGIAPVLIEHGSAHLVFGNALFDWIVRGYEHGITQILKRYRPQCYGVSAKSEEWLEHFGLSSMGLLNNAIDAAEFREASSGRDFRGELGLTDDNVVIAFVGRLLPEKGIEAFLDAAEELRGDSVAFVVAGSGPLESEIIRRSLVNVRFVGKLARSDVSALLQASDALCLPSRSEGFATALLESAACGTLALSTDVGGCAELLGEDAPLLLLQEPSGSEVARGVRWVVTHRGEAHAMGERMRERAERSFTWDATADLAAAACARAQASATIK